MKPSIRSLLAFLIISCGHTPAAENAPGRRSAQEALKAYAPLVGEWKGVGQPQRGSSKGAWTETGDWAWKLSPDSASLVLTVAKGRFLKEAELRAGKEPGTFELAATLADGTPRTFVGKAGEKGKLALAAMGDGAEGVRRITLTPLHETRFLLLLEGQEVGGRGFPRLAEVGYTRQGVEFAAGETHPTCIVTEGRGTMQVSYKGQTYYVCCTGCRDLFKDDPEAVLAEAKEREKSKAKP